MKMIPRLCTVAAMLLSASSIYGQTTLQSFVIGSGGSVLVGNGQPNSFICGTVGQPIISGQITAGSTSRWEGFWVPVVNNPTSVDEETTLTYGDVRVFPNPMRESAQLTFDAQLEGMVTVRVYDAVGLLVQTIEQNLSVAGNQSVAVTVIDENGDPMASGAYLCVIDGFLANGKPYHTTARLSVVK